MTDAANIAATIKAGLARRHGSERRFRLYGISAIGFSCLMLVILLATILRPGISGFMRHEVELTIDTAPILEALRNNPESIDFYKLTQTSLREGMQRTPSTAAERRQFASVLGFFAADEVRREVMDHAEDWGRELTVWVPLSSDADMLLKGKTEPSEALPLQDQLMGWLQEVQNAHETRATLNMDFFTRGDSRAPEAAGFLGAIVGSLLTLIVCMALAMPIAIMAAITLEEFAKKTRIAEWLEITINNLAAVPSIIYGLLGLSVFLQVMNAPRSSALVGGLTLAIMILPVMIIAARAAIRAVPPSMRQAATALGATRLQVVRHHVLPYALPGIMTGTILAVCRALGETAPLLMIGMVAFVADIPRGFTDPATAMPVEIYLWASTPEAGFIEKTSSAILVLLVILLLLNMAAIRLRNRSQLTWN